ncbi:MAG: hypothetical protein GWM98_03975, partial [Nitrospinaceae bacterium]|nr:hypothetical protein [Nitrospinaceae bacterium]
LSEPHLDTTPEIRAKVNDLVGGLTEPDQKIEALFNFVSREIRYMGITAETVSPGYEPHDVADTFNARHGVCRDKAALLVAMLREAGLDAFPALINNGPKKDPEVPQPYFNHAIVAVRLDGGFRLMDPTDETTRELLPSYLDDCSFLVATPEGETLMTSGIEPSDVNLLRIETRGQVDDEGRLGATTRLVFNGINDNAYRGYFARIKPEERRRFFESVAKRVVPRARVTEVEILPSDMMDTSTSLTVRVSFEADDVLVQGNALTMLPLPVMGTRLGMVNFVIGKTGLESRRYPLKTGYACGVQETLELTLPDACGEAEIIPDFTPVEHEAIRWHAAMEQKGSRVAYEADFRLEVSEFSPDEYGLLKET